MSDIFEDLMGAATKNASYNIAADKRAVIQENLSRELNKLLGGFSHYYTPVKTSDSVVRVSISEDHGDRFAEILVVWHPTHGTDIDRLLLDRSSKYVVVIYADRFRVDLYEMDVKVEGYIGWRYLPALSRVVLVDDTDTACATVWELKVSDLYLGRPVFETTEYIEAFA